MAVLELIKAWCHVLVVQNLNSKENIFFRLEILCHYDLDLLVRMYKEL